MKELKRHGKIVWWPALNIICFDLYYGCANIDIKLIDFRYLEHTTNISCQQIKHQENNILPLLQFMVIGQLVGMQEDR
uniref:Uncharacterized protein n=1 Tax=Megaselia scalaris TaxID=36166 RepID=T1GTR3_MEGSC